MTYIKNCEGGFDVVYNSGWVESAVEMMPEHFSAPKTSVWVNTSYEDMKLMQSRGYVFDDVKYVHYNMEHKCPIDASGNVPYCSEYWRDVFNESLGFFSEVWDFQIENYEYYRYHGLDSKFRFRPLRYASWFEPRRTDAVSEYDVQIECVFDTRTRLEVICALTNEPVRVYDDGTVRRDPPRTSILLTNTGDAALKMREKNRCRYGMDFPHYDTPCTINTFRIYEYVCMNKPVIVWDRDGLSSRKYFGDLCIWVDKMDTWDVKQIVKRPPRTDVAAAFRDMTYSDSDYDTYRLGIIRDYCDRTGKKVPDSVMH